MDYQKHYSLLIESRKQNPTESDYHEKHHILPRSLGGDDSKENLVKLTAREHFVAHLLLAKIHGGKMWAALAYMSRGDVKSAQGVRVGARLYASIRQRDIEWRRVAYAGENNYWYGKKIPEEHRAKMRGPRPSIAGKNNPGFGKKFPERGVLISAVQRYTSLKRFDVDDTLQRYIDSSLGIGSKSKELAKLSQWYRGKNLAIAAAIRDIAGEKNPNYGNGQAISGDKNPMWGKEHKASTKRKISEKAKRRIECPHCGKLGNIANMHRWHLDNCKKKRA